MKFLPAILFTALLGWANVQSVSAQSLPDWGRGASFGINGYQKISNTGTTRITGDVCALFKPTGFSKNTIYNGAIYDVDSPKFFDADNDLDALYSDLELTNYYKRSTDLSGMTLGSASANDLIPGTYTFSGAAEISGTLRLNDGGNKLALYIFKVGDDFNVDAAAKVLMKSGGAAPNVYWVVNGQSTVGANASLAGNIITEYMNEDNYDYENSDYYTNKYPAITMNSGASISGKLASYNDGISLDNNSINSAMDTDGDGVPDSYDDYPNDATRAHNNISSTATIAFEDLWPFKGDYDMNDLVMKYSYNLVTNARNYVVQVISADTLLATGGIKANAFGIEFPIQAEFVGKINSGTQETGQMNAVFMLFKNMRDEMTSWNTIPGVPLSEPRVYSVDFRIDGAKQIALADFTVAMINPFIVNYQGKSRREVHLPGKQPTNLADKTILGTGDDSSNKNGRGTYLTANGLPWAIVLPTASFKYPAETKDISTVYLHFADWAISSGINFIFWYTDSKDRTYRNNTFIYTASGM